MTKPIRFDEWKDPTTRALNPLKLIAYLFVGVIGFTLIDGFAIVNTEDSFVRIPLLIVIIFIPIYYNWKSISVAKNLESNMKALAHTNGWMYQKEAPLNDVSLLPVIGLTEARGNTLHHVINGTIDGVDFRLFYVSGKSSVKPIRIGSFPDRTVLQVYKQITAPDETLLFTKIAKHGDSTLVWWQYKANRRSSFEVLFQYAELIPPTYLTTTPHQESVHF